MLRRCLVVGSLLGLLLSAGSIPARLHAAIIAADSFEAYTTGATLNGNSGGTGFTGSYAVPSANQATVTVVPLSLSYTGGTVSVNGGSNAVQISGANDATALIARSLQSSATGTIYFSFLYNTSSASEAFLQLGLGNSLSAEPYASIGLQGIAGSGGGAEGFFARIPNAGTTTLASSGISVNTTYFVVGKISTSATNYDRVDFFLNPTSNVEGAASFSATNTSGGLSSFNSLVLRTARTDAGSLYNLDALTIGTTFADVVPTAVPEPSLLAWLALPVVGWLWRRQRVTA